MKATKRTIPYLLGLALLAATCLPLAHADRGESVELVDYRLAGDSVAVTLSNSDGTARSAVVSVTVEKEGIMESSRQEVTVPAHGTAGLELAFGPGVDTVVHVGIAEGGEPW
jgi:hypothetical protein